MVPRNSYLSLLFAGEAVRPFGGLNFVAREQSGTGTNFGLASSILDCCPQPFTACPLEFEPVPDFSLLPFTGEECDAEVIDR
jgi:hypothetical protein